MELTAIIYLDHRNLFERYFMKKTLLIVLILGLLLSLPSCKKQETAPEFNPVVQTPVSAETGFCLTVSESYSLNMLRASLPENSPFTVEGLDFSADSTLKISGKVNLRALGKANNLPFHSLYPTSIDFSTAGSFVYQKESGVSITPLSLEILGFEISLDTLPETLYQPYQQKINSYLEALPMTLADLYLTDDAIVITG